MRTQTTQAKRLEEFMDNMRKKGFEMRINAKGNVWGIRRGNGYQAARDMIRGKKAYYSRDYFRQVGALIMEKTSLRVVDTAA
jgi:hypothetical protein